MYRRKLQNINILITEYDILSNDAVSRLTDIGTVYNYPIRSQDDLLTIAQTNGHKFNVLMVGPKFKIKKQIIDCFPNLKFILSPTTGLDHLSIEYCKHKNVLIFSLYGETDFLETISSTAEHTFGLIIALIRKTHEAINDVKRNNWESAKYWGTELKGKKIGILGLGRVGKMIAKYAHSFNMNVVAYDIDKNVYSPYVRLLYHNLYEFLEDLDILTIHVPLKEETKNILTNVEFYSMKRGNCIINTSRGKVVDINDLLFALKEGQVSGAALDVLPNEPKIQEEILDYIQNNSNLLITPHIAGSTYEAREKTDLFVINKFISAIKN